MRTIKFRGFSEELKKWIYGAYLHVPYMGKDGIHFIIPDYGSFFDVLPKSTGQFIGRRDKNGKEIFEGDVVKYPNGRVYVIKYFSQYSRFAGSENFIEDKLPLCSFNFDVVEIVGNIFENPELMDVQNAKTTSRT